MSSEIAKSTGGIKALIQSDVMQEQFRKAMPKIITPEKLIRTALTAFNKTPNLLACSESSLMSAMMASAETGLLPDGYNAHLVPYKNKCTFIADYKGLVALARRSGEVADIQVHPVHENDFFEWDTGKITHKIDWRNPRGEPYLVYTILILKDGTTTYGRPMTKEEALAIQRRSPAGKSGPWITDFLAMWMKSAIRRDSKLWPRSAELQKAMELENDDYQDDSRGGYVSTSGAGDRLSSALKADGQEVGPAAHEKQKEPETEPEPEPEPAPENVDEDEGQPEQADVDTEEKPVEIDRERLISVLAKAINRAGMVKASKACISLDIDVSKWHTAETEKLSELYEMIG